MILCGYCRAIAKHLTSGEGDEYQMSVPGLCELPIWSLCGDLAGSQRGKRLAVPKCPSVRTCYLIAREFFSFLVNGSHFPANACIATMFSWAFSDTDLFISVSICWTVLRLQCTFPSACAAMNGVHAASLFLSRLNKKCLRVCLGRPSQKCA